MESSNRNGSSDNEKCWADLEKNTTPLTKKEKLPVTGLNFKHVENRNKTLRCEKYKAVKGFIGNLPTVTGKIFCKKKINQQCANLEVLSELSTHGVCTESSGLIAHIDNGTKSRIDKGKYHIDAEVDLHGLSTDIAYDLLADFIAKSFEAQHKCVLVITGWGSKSNGSGVIRSNLYKWLQSMPLERMVLYYTQAQAIHGGKGAFYVLLRTKRKQQD